MICGGISMKIVKRDGHMVDYCPEKIEKAIEKANLEVEEEERASSVQIKNIIKYIENLKKKRITFLSCLLSILHRFYTKSSCVLLLHRFLYRIHTLSL